MKFVVSGLGRKITWDRTFAKLFKSPANIASGILPTKLTIFWEYKKIKTTILSSNPKEFRDLINLLLQEKEAGKNFKITNQQIIAIVEKLIEYNCIARTQHLKNCKTFAN